MILYLVSLFFNIKATEKKISNIQEIRRLCIHQLIFEEPAKHWASFNKMVTGKTSSKGL